MANADDGRGAPASAENRTVVQGRSRQNRLIPGGSLDAAKTPIGMNAVDRDMLPSYGVVDWAHADDTPKR
jgi:hypothetical protein